VQETGARNCPKSNVRVHRFLDEYQYGSECEIGAVAPLSDTRCVSSKAFRRLLMSTSSRDRISVDLHGLRALLFERARPHGVSPSALVRDALVKALEGGGEGSVGRAESAAPVPSEARVRLTLLMSREEAKAILEAARQAGLTPGAYIAGLMAAVPVLTSGANRRDHIATLTASNAELSILSRNIHHLTSLLREGNVRLAMEYRTMLDTLAGDVRTHLKLASGVLADLQPQRRRLAGAVKHPTT
jgi:hypothetical protein